MALGNSASLSVHNGCPTVTIIRLYLLSIFQQILTGSELHGLRWVLRMG